MMLSVTTADYSQTGTWIQIWRADRASLRTATALRSRLKYVKKIYALINRKCVEIELGTDFSQVSYLIACQSAE